jgi:DNA-binding SARP family transcriptional activator
VTGPLGEVRLSGRLAEVFALLLLGLDRDAIADAIWPELDRERARNNLYVQLNHLRKLLEPWGVTTYLTEAGLTRVRADLFELEEALQTGDAHAALARYREPVFPGIDNPRVDAYREALKARLVNLLRAALHAHPDETLLEGLFSLEPWEPEAAARWIHALMERGRRERALAVYRRFTEAFAATLDEPPPPLDALLRLA